MKQKDEREETNVPLSFPPMISLRQREAKKEGGRGGRLRQLINPFVEQ